MIEMTNFILMRQVALYLKLQIPLPRLWVLGIESGS